MTGCPQASLTPDIFDLLEAGGFARDGILPMAGGMMNQTAVFKQALRRLWNEEAIWKAKQKS